MPSVDEQLSRALREAAPRPTTSGLDQRLARRRRARAFRRRVGTAALAVVVLAGTAAGFLALSDAFEGDGQVREPSPTLVEPTPTETPPPTGETAVTLAGVPFPICRPSSIPGDFGSDLDTAWIFEEERVPGAGCVGSEGFQHVGVGTRDEVVAFSDRLTTCLDSMPCQLFAAPDVNRDGGAEIAVSTGRADGIEISLYAIGRDPVTVEPVTVPERLGGGSVDSGPLLFRWGGTVGWAAGASCTPAGHLWITSSTPIDPELERWEVRWTVVGLDGATAYPFSEGASEVAREDVKGGGNAFCGSPVFHRTVQPRFEFEFGFSVPLCRVQPFGPADVNGDGSEDTVSMGVAATDVNGCPEPGREDYLLGIDLNGDQLVDLEDDSMNCEAWCSVFALVDLSGDGKAEILLNEGHTAYPASAVIAVYELVPSASTDPYLEPVSFPDGSNRFHLVDSGYGWHGAYCAGPDTFTTWEIPGTGVGGVVPSITYREYQLNDGLWRFELREETTIEAPDAEFPAPDRRGYDGVFCGVEVETPG